MSAPILTRRDALVGAAAGALAAATGASAQAGADLTELSIAAAGRRIANGDLSPVALTEAYLARIARLNPQVNAYITVMAETAVAQARAAEVELAAGRRRGPLHGIPVGLKDNIDTAGVRTTAASAVYENRVPEQDAEVVRRLKEAGAVILGKLNMHEFAYGGTTAITHFGPTRNPWDLNYAVGGSSGGSGAATAARMCAGALGTDTAASIRLPAAFCGVVGLKATYGLASIRGIVPLADNFDHVGPLARSVADAALMMGAIAGYDTLDMSSINAPIEDYAAAVGRDVSGLRIGVPRRPFFEDLDPEIEAATDAALGLLEGMVAEVRDIELPAIPDSVFSALLADVYAYHSKLLADPQNGGLYHPVTLGRIMDGGRVSLPAYIEGRRWMTVARKTIVETFRDIDVLVSPTSMAMPSTVAAALADPSTNDSELIRNTLPYDVFGTPAISVPCGFTAGGLPIGLQIAGPPLGEGVVIALADAYEQAADWRLRRPPLG
jgi:aspartyl-tRNA(Asn)/glutamyl-tRNA(Gln) amidotransferase subunit A